MSRPGFVLEVDERTPPLLIAEGAGCRQARLPLGTRVAYPAESNRSVPNLTEALAGALATPIDQPPLESRLKPGMKLAIVFTDGSRPASGLTRPDLRSLVLERVLELAARAGVDDVRLVAANGLRRRQSPEEIAGVVGERVHRSFQADGRLEAHDAEAPDLVVVEPGTGTDHSTAISLNKAVAEADLVINIVIAASADHTGWDQLATGVTDSTSAWSHASVAEVLADTLSVFQIELALDQGSLPSTLNFLSRREWEWKVSDRVSFQAFRRLGAIAQHRVRRTYVDSRPGRFGVISVAAGSVEGVAEVSRTALRAQQTVDVGAAADVVIAGPAPVTEHNRGVVMNPLVAAWDVLGRTFHSNTGTPAVRAGGAMILFHPLAPAFNSRHHAASADFFADVLPRLADPAELDGATEDRFATDEWYVNLYRTQNAFHGTHPLQLVQSVQAARSHCSDIIWVGADRSSAERMGFRAASTLADALEISVSSVGRSPDILHLHTPPTLVADVTT